MSKDFVKPDVASVTSLLQMFLGEELVVTGNDSPEFTGRYVATYVDDNDALVALCACDIPFVAYTGAALSMVPVGAAEDAIASKDITPVMVDNFHEVMNICSKLMMSDTSAHLRLDKALTPEQSADSISTLQEKAGELCGFDVKVPGYGDGSLTFMLG